MMNTTKHVYLQFVVTLGFKFKKFRRTVFLPVNNNFGPPVVAAPLNAGNTLGKYLENNFVNIYDIFGKGS